MSDAHALAELVERLLDSASDEAVERLAARLTPFIEAQTPEAREEQADDELIDPDEAARILGYTRPYVLRLRRQRALPGHKPEGRKYVRFRKSDVIAYRDAHRSGASPSTVAVAPAGVRTTSGHATSGQQTRRRF